MNSFTRFTNRSSTMAKVRHAGRRWTSLVYLMLWICTLVVVVVPVVLALLHVNHYYRIKLSLSSEIIRTLYNYTTWLALKRSVLMALISAVFGLIAVKVLWNVGRCWWKGIAAFLIASYSIDPVTRSVSYRRLSELARIVAGRLWRLAVHPRLVQTQAAGPESDTRRVDGSRLSGSFDQSLQKPKSLTIGRQSSAQQPYQDGFAQAADAQWPSPPCRGRRLSPSSPQLRDSLSLSA